METFNRHCSNKTLQTFQMYQFWYAWWRHQMETFSALLAICVGNSPVTGEFPPQRPVTRSVDVSFDLRLNKRLSKQFCGWRFGTPSPPLWCHCYERSLDLRLAHDRTSRYPLHVSVSNHMQIDCLFNNLFRLTIDKTPKLHVTGSLWREPQKASNAESISMSRQYNAGVINLQIHMYDPFFVQCSNISGIWIIRGPFH